MSVLFLFIFALMFLSGLAILGMPLLIFGILFKFLFEKENKDPFNTKDYSIRLIKRR